MITRDDNFKPYELPRTWDRIRHVAALPPQKILLPMVVAALITLIVFFQPVLLWCVLFGIALQYVIEYCIHRFLYHMAPPSEVNGLFKWLYSSHWGHHDFPNNPNLWGGTDLLFVPIVSSIFFLLFSGIFWVIGLSDPVLKSFITVFLGAIPTYITYEWAHVTAHAAGRKNALERYITREHAAHHFQDFSTNYHVNAGGIIVDKAFGTAFSKEDYMRPDHIRTMGLAPDDPRLIELRTLFADTYGISGSDLAKALK
ncbi:MAG: sterol desaturase family protein [Pseudomonadota bacterium]